MGAIVPIRTANGVFFQRVSGACSSGKIFEIEVLWDASLVYYKVRCTVITNCDSFFITKYDTAYYKLQQVLQSAMNLLNCDYFYKLRQYKTSTTDVAYQCSTVESSREISTQNERSDHPRISGCRSRPSQWQTSVIRGGRPDESYAAHTQPVT